MTSLSETPAISLPLDLVAEILCRLSVKQLIQLCCVCKSWNSLISHDSSFAKNQLRFSTTCHHLTLTSINHSRQLLQCHSPISSIFTSASTTNFQSPPPPFTWFEGYDVQVSTCHGLLSFSINGSLSFLCNPSIRKFKTLPPFKTTDHTLVYDRFIDNYKIVALTFSHYNKKEVHIHTIGTDYWRKIHDFPSHSLASNSSGGPGIFVSDTVNWLAYDTCTSLVVDTSLVIVSLDLKKESYRKLLMRLGLSVTLGALRDCLCIVSHSYTFSDVWIMKEYGNENSWTKLLRVPRMRDIGLIGYTKALYISEDNHVLMEFRTLEKFGLLVYDSINNTFKIPTIQNINRDKMASLEVYVESLISPFF